MVDEGGDGSDRAAWGARLLAPLAFFLAATVMVLLIQDALNAEGGGNPEPATPVAAPGTTGDTGGATGAAPGTAPETRTTPPPATTQAQQKRFYRVRAGDTLESIAARFNTDVETLLDLNPDIDPLSLPVGQRLRVA